MAARTLPACIPPLRRQVELTGSSVFDYIHPGDHSEVLEQLGLRTRTSGPPTPPSIPSSSSSSSSLADTPEIGNSKGPQRRRPDAGTTGTLYPAMLHVNQTHSP